MSVNSVSNDVFSKYGTFNPINTPKTDLPKLQNEPPKDTFEKKAETPMPVAVQPQELPVNNETPKSKWLTKENIIIAGAGLALSGTIAAYAIIRGKSANKILNAAQAQLKGVQDQLADNQRITAELRNLLQKTQADSAESQKTIDALRRKLGDFTELPSDLKRAKEILIQRYRNMISGAKLNYDPLAAPTKADFYNAILRGAKKIFGFDTVKPMEIKSLKVAEPLDTQALKRTLTDRGSVNISLPKTTSVKPLYSPAAYIDDTVENLGKTVNTDFKLNYGRNMDWSEQKVARDIMQNFYDGHGNTLDGVNLAIKKLPSGEYSVKVSGMATYDYENLQFLGSGSKIENPFNAGGFGEGAKVLVSSMLGKGDTKSVKYSCANWNLVFDGANGKMRRTLQKVSTPLDGNSIEFTTSNKNLVDSLIDSVNYFKHSKNPDFQTLHFDSPNFAFRFMDKEAKGNVYLTQRFEFKQDGAWDNNVDNLTLIFKRKPDAKRYKAITGTSLPKDRDRTSLTVDDIKNLSRYFASEMADEDLVRAFKTTQPMWDKLAKEQEAPKALTGFLDGMISEMEKRGIVIDFSKEKYAAVSKYGINDVVKDLLNEYNYIPCPERFSEIGVPKAEDIFRSYSVHKALKPTTDEVKKLKLLEEGIKVIKSDIDSALQQHIANPTISFSPNLKSKDYYKSILPQLNNTIPEIEKITKKYGYSIDKLSDADFRRYKTEVEQALRQILKNNPDDRTLQSIFYQPFRSIDSFDKMTEEYIKTYKTLKLINADDVTKPRYIFNRNAEPAKNTLGEAIVSRGEYNGHWVDREYLETADFNTILATWLHEICHKSGGDGSAEFTYTLTDMLRVLLNTSTKGSNQMSRTRLAALEEIYNGISNAVQKAA